MGVDAAAFAETMDKWNGYVEAKNDPDFGRTSFANPLNTAPYYAVKVTAGVHHTMGGLKINANTEVLNEKGEVIPGLFAAGEVTGGVHGANRLGGNAVADFTVFGKTPELEGKPPLRSRRPGGSCPAGLSAASAQQDGAAGSSRGFRRRHHRGAAAG